MELRDTSDGFPRVAQLAPGMDWTSGLANTRPTGEMEPLLDVRQSTVTRIHALVNCL